MTRIHELAEYGQSIWLDYIHRYAMEDGTIADRLASGVQGVTSNPSIFEKAIAGSQDYDKDIQRLSARGLGVENIYESLVVDDIRRAADMLQPAYEQTAGKDGYISLEVSPRLAHETDATVSEAKRLLDELSRPNVMIKIPATQEGIPAIRMSIAEGINVNVTLIFSIRQYEDVVDAHMAGLESRLRAGLPVSGIASVASFFISRVDTAVDDALKELSQPHLMGHAALDNARLAYARFEKFRTDDRWKKLEQAGASIQRPLWASTGTKNPKYSDTLYVDGLIGPGTVNTIPPATLDAFLDHGQISQTISQDLDGALKRMAELADVGIDLGEITNKLLRDGVASFAKAFDGLLNSIRVKVMES